MRGLNRENAGRIGRVVAVAAALMSLSAAGADEFYLRYDAEGGFPEEQGWSRRYDDTAGEIVRELRDGIFVDDTRSSIENFDLYEIWPKELNLNEGETLEITWRMRTLETDDSALRSDVAVSIANSSNRYAQFFLAADFVSEHWVNGRMKNVYGIAGGAFHTYRFVSNDMSRYELFVNDEFAFADSFHDVADGPRVAFGDTISGRSSLAEWDFVEVNVIPEPTSGLALLALVPFIPFVRRLIGSRPDARTV